MKGKVEEGEAGRGRMREREGKGRMREQERERGGGERSAKGVVYIQYFSWLAVSETKFNHMVVNLNCKKPLGSGNGSFKPGRRNKFYAS